MFKLLVQTLNMPKFECFRKLLVLTFVDSKLFKVNSIQTVVKTLVIH